MLRMATLVLVRAVHAFLGTPRPCARLCPAGVGGTVDRRPELGDVLDHGLERRRRAEDHAGVRKMYTDFGQPNPTRRQQRIRSVCLTRRLQNPPIRKRSTAGHWLGRSGPKFTL